ncbi:MAG: hypothetical protein RLZZ181_599 [Pseudomonadota bacterium]|jgi:hypothetical protein
MSTEAENTAPVAAETDLAAQPEGIETETGAEAPELEAAETTAKPEPKKEEPKLSKKAYKAKVNGKEQTLELGDDEIVQYIQKAMAADEKFNEAAMTRKQVESFINDLRKNPLAILRHPELGIDVKSLAEQVLLDEIAELEKSPEQKKLEDMERKLREHEERAKKLEEEKQEAEMQRMKAEQFKKFDDDIVDALQSTNLPKSAYVVKRITDTMIEALSLEDGNGNQLYPDVTIKDIMPYVEESLKAEMEQMFQIMPTEMLEKLVGKNHFNNLRKNRVAQAKAKPASVSDIKETAKAAAKQSETKDTKKQSFDDVFGRF